MRLLGLAVSVLLATASIARGGNIYLTGHDILLHDGQEGYDEVILDFLREAGTPNEIPRANYDIGVIGSDVGSWGWTNVPDFNDRGTGPNVPPGFESTTFYNTIDLNGNAALQAAALSHDVLVILSHTSCGGCDLTNEGSNVINTQMAAGIASAFNVGMDLWVNTGAQLPTFYDFLPPEFATTAPPIMDSVFCANAEGMAIGITPEMTTGFPTHNRFEGFSDLLTILETNCPGDPEQVISLGASSISLGSELTPFLDFNAPGTQHTVTLAIADAPVAGIVVTFTVLSGPNAGDGAVVKADAGGIASFTYVGDGGIGADSIRASFEDPTTGETLNSNVVLKFWDDDCNGNGLPDTCDIDCDGFGGVCNALQPICGGSTDGNGDGVPDECVPGTIIFVDGTCGDDTWSGAESTCAAPNGPKETIQAAIIMAVHGDQIVIAPATYPERIDFLGKAITVRSSGGAAVTTIDGQGTGPVVTCANGEGPLSVLFDLTITGGSAFRGGGMYNLDSSPTVINCIFRGNTAPGSGGGMYNQGRNPSVSNCTFGGNTASTGGAMANDMSNPAVTNCVFAGNSANFGGAVHNLASNPTLTNCTFNRNSAGNGGGAIYGGAVSGVQVTNSILWNSSPNAVETDVGSQISVDFCNVQGGFPGVTNIDALPLFADATGPDDIPGTADDDLRLLFPSPCIDAANNAAFTSCLPDRAGNERFVDEPLIPDCPLGGCGVAPIIDIGAYEFGGTPTLDCNTNGLIDICEIDTGRAPDCNGNGIPDECDLADGTSQDCNGNFIPDTCDIDSGLSIDCDGNLVPDECEVLFLIAESPQLSPFGAGSPQSFTIFDAPDSGGSVALSFEAIGDLGGTVEFVVVNINGTPVGEPVFVHARDCPVQPSTDEIVISSAVYNAAITSEAVINMVAEPLVDPDLCSSFISVTVSYQAITAADQNGNGLPDDCECPLDLDGSGTIDVPDLLQLLAAWGLDPGGPPDFDGDGEVSVPDLLALLASWGSSCF